MEHELMKMLEEIDEKIKGRLKQADIVIWERSRLLKARQHVQEAISALLG